MADFNATDVFANGGAGVSTFTAVPNPIKAGGLHEAPVGGMSGGFGSTRPALDGGSRILDP